MPKEMKKVTFVIEYTVDMGIVDIKEVLDALRDMGGDADVTDVKIKKVETK